MKLTMSHTNEGLNYLTYVDVYDEIIVRDYDSLEDFENFLEDRDVVLEIYDWINSLEGTEYSNDFESPKPYPSSKAGEFWGVHKGHIRLE